MIRLPSIVYVATEPVNLHFSFDRLAGIVREQLGADPREELFRLCVDNNLVLLEMSRREISLEDVFRDLTMN